MYVHSNDSRIVTSSDTRLAAGNDTEVLRTLARVAVARALVAVERGGPKDSDARAGLRAACAAARQRGLHAEDLLILIKDSWHTIADGHFLNRLDSHSALSRLVSVCIDEFYEAHEDGH